MDFKDTLNLPKTEFPMRASLPTREPEMLRDWEAVNVYASALAARQDAPPFILHDGPPYANGNIHLGHTLNKVLKDMVVRFHTMSGKRAPFIPGWDCHGLPIEQQVLKTVGDRLHDMEPLELRKLCAAYAGEWVDTQRNQFKRLGVVGDWDHPYLTMAPEYEAGILTVLLELVKKGLIRKGFRTVHWDPVFRTALAEAEIEYHPHVSPSIYVAMPLLEIGRYPSLRGLSAAAFVIWTTTPWTMPANLGVALHPDFDYVAVKTATGETYIVAEGRLSAFLVDCQIESAEVVAKFKAGEFESGQCAHPIFEGKSSLIMLGDHVTLEQGTGCVHTAPGHGADDFNLGRRYGLPVFSPVDKQGRYTAEYQEMQGTFVFDANPKVVAKLRENGLLLAEKKVHHDYPYSWRSKQPIIFRATEQWFMELAEGGVRERALEAIDNAVEWVPRWGYERMRSMVERRPEWCISRQRHWGVPIPSVRRKSTGQSLLAAEVVERFRDVVRTRGTDAWYSQPLANFLPPIWDASDYEKEFDILDVWFDSGASHTAVLKQDQRVHYPADLYLEGSDQHRGWFQHALLLAEGAHDNAPFKTVLTHGFVLDAEGRAMSKSLGNVISPLDLMKEYGADILRLWVASTDYRNDVAIGPEILKPLADAYRTIRNTLRFELGNLYDFDPTHDLVAPEDLPLLDQWALFQLVGLIDEVSEAYRQYEFHRVYQVLNRFFSVTLSARYHDILKDRLYTFPALGRERRSAQTVVYHHLTSIVKLLGPVLCFTADEAWRSAPGTSGFLHAQDWPTVPDAWRALANPAAVTEELFVIRDRVNDQLEALRSAKEIGKALDAQVTLTVAPDSREWDLLGPYLSQLPELFMVSDVLLNAATPGQSLQIHVRPAAGERCPRCWRWVPHLVPYATASVCPRCSEALAPSPSAS